MTPKRRDDLKTWELEGEAVVYDGRSGMGHVLNPTALRIWSLCDGKRSTSAIEKVLVETYPAQREEVSRDVAEALHRLMEAGLLQAA